MTLAFVPNFFAFLVRLAREQAALLKVITYYGNNWAGKILLNTSIILSKSNKLYFSYC